jgi:hypothetical protein
MAEKYGVAAWRPCWTTRTAAADGFRGSGGQAQGYDTVVLYSIGGMHTGGQVRLERR